MNATLSVLKRDFLDHESICCFLCDENGIIYQLGRRLLMRYPHAFQKGRHYTEYFPADENIKQVQSDLSENGYAVTQPIQMFGEIFFFCLFLCRNPQNQKQYILCKLEENLNAVTDTPFFSYKEYLTSYNLRLLSNITDCCQNLVSAENALQAVRDSEALQRNQLLLSILDAVQQIGKSEKTVSLKQLCMALQKQMQLTESTLSLRVIFHLAVSERYYYLDTERFFEMLFALFTLFAMQHDTTTLHLQLTEDSGRFTLRTNAKLSESSDESQKTLHNCLIELLHRFANHYGGQFSLLFHDDLAHLQLDFTLADSSAYPCSLILEQDSSEFSVIDRLLPLLRYADR